MNATRIRLDLRGTEQADMGFVNACLAKLQAGSPLISFLAHDGRSSRATPADAISPAASMSLIFSSHGASLPREYVPLPRSPAVPLCVVVVVGSASNDPTAPALLLSTGAERIHVVEAVPRQGGRRGCRRHARAALCANHSASAAMAATARSIGGSLPS